MKIDSNYMMNQRELMRDLLVKLFRSRTRNDNLNYAELIENQFSFFQRRRFTKVMNELSMLDFGSEDYKNKKNEFRTMAETLERKLYSLKNLGRAAVLAGGLALTAGSFPAYAQEATTQVEQKPFVMRSDDVLKQYMKTPVNELLEGIAVPVNDNNYQTEVFGSDRPVMVLFYGDSDFSNGLGALVKVLNEEFSQIKVCTYYCNYRDGDRSKRDMDQLIDRLRSKKYPIKSVLPLLVFYKYNDGTVEYMGNDWNMNGGLKTSDGLKRNQQNYSKYIPEELIN